MVFPETLSSLETSQYENGTRNKGEVRDCRISGDKDCARSSGLFMTYCTRVVESRIDAPGKNEDTQGEIRGSYATHGNSGGLAQLSLS